MKKTLIILALAASFSAMSSSGAFAIESEWVCKGTNYDPYACTADWGYVGYDNYQLYQYSSGPSYDLHGCTSFAGYMLWMFNAHASGIYHFNSAQYWDNEAPSKGIAQVGSVPHVGDIAQWEANAAPTQGHVAWVKALEYHPSGALKSIVVVDDNYTLRYTSQRRVYFGSNSAVLPWPSHFITFPAAPPSPGTGSGGGTVIWDMLSTYFED